MGVIATRTVETTCRRRALRFASLSFSFHQGVATAKINRMRRFRRKRRPRDEVINIARHARSQLADPFGRTRAIKSILRTCPRNSQFPSFRDSV